MFATALIVFREVLEAALIVSIVMVASRGVDRRGFWVAGGIAAGLLGAGMVAGFADAISSAFEGVGQELMNAGILFTAVAMLGWHNIWMARHARELSQEMTRVGQDVASGARPLYALMVVVGMAVLREGSEVVLFLYGIASGGTETANAMLAGGAIGVAAGVALGFAMYGGLLRVPQRALFATTSWLILLLAAGMAAHGAGYLSAAGVLPDIVPEVWDTSAILSESSVFGRVMQTLVGYIERPSLLQILFYAGTILVIGGLMRALAPNRPAAQSAAAVEKVKAKAA